MVNPATGKRVISFKPPKFGGDLMLVPCGKCRACRENRRLQWIKRCKLELLSCNGVASFLTLTYNGKNCPEHLVKKHLQDFFKRLRNVNRDYGLNLGKLRYFAVGEYGSKKKRPHYHAIVFNVDLLSPQFRPYLATSKGSYPIFASKVIERYWTFGFNTVDSVTDANIRYVSKYVSKGVCDSLCLTSQGLGRSVFVDVSRVGRKSVVKPKPILIDSSQTDKFVISVGDVPRPLPSFALRYVERLFPVSLLTLKQKRKAYYLGKSKSSSWYSQTVREHDLKLNDSLEQLKRILHDEK